MTDSKTKAPSPPPLTPEPQEPETSDARTLVSQDSLSSFPHVEPLPPPPMPKFIAQRYKVLERLGEGGMGTVFRVHDQQLDETVALKMLHPNLLRRSKILQRFRREVKLARRITHPNVVRTFDLGEANGTHYLTMEWIDGQSLSQRIQEHGAIPLKMAIDIILQLCAGLQAAHQAKVIHRDLKPDNVLIAHDGRVAITDFGIARSQLNDADGVTTANAVIGTPAYISPEQLDSKAQIDQRVDIYALGTIFYEMLTGLRAWYGDNFYTVAMARFMNPPPDPRERNTLLPTSVCQLVQRCMALSPDERYQQAEEIIHILQSLKASPTFESSALQTPSLPTNPGTAAHTKLPSFAPTPTTPGDTTIAVLPLRNQGPDSLSYIAEGLTEELIDTLSCHQELKVRPHGMSLATFTPDTNPAQLGQALNVQVVVVGSVTPLPPSHEQLQIRIRLISSHDSFQLWAKRFQCHSSEVLVISEQISHALAEALAIQSQTPERNVLKDPAAVDLYLRARHAMRQEWHGEIQTAIDLFTEALKHAPDDPLLLSGAAIARARFAYIGGQERHQEADVARILAQRARSLAPERAESHFALAMISHIEGDWVHAIRALHVALSKSSTYAEAHDLLGRILLEIGPLDKAIKQLRLAITLDPNLTNTRWDLIRGYALDGQWEQVDRLMNLPVESREHEGMRIFLQARLNLWRPDPQTPDLSKVSTTNEVSIFATNALEQVRQTREFTEEQAELFYKLRDNHVNPRMRSTFTQILAETLAYLKQEDAFFDALEESASFGLLDIVWLEHCPPLRPYQGHPRWLNIHRQLKQRIDTGLTRV